MLITIKQTTTTEKEVNIDFPFFTYDDYSNRFYMNYEHLKCVQISRDTNSILHSKYSNDGLEFREIKKEEFFKAFDENLQTLLTILNK